MRLVRPRILLGLTGALTLAACASAGSGSGPEPGDPEGVYDRYLISAEEVEEFRFHSQGTAWDVIQEARPRWLRPQYVGGFRNRGVLPAVFVDEMRRGGAGVLRRISMQEIERIRFIPGREAGVRYGTGYPAGIIMVYTRRG